MTELARELFLTLYFIMWQPNPDVTIVVGDTRGYLNLALCEQARSRWLELKRDQYDVFKCLPRSVGIVQYMEQVDVFIDHLIELHRLEQK